MARKLLLALIFSAGNGQAIGMYVRNSEPGMIKFTNKWYLFHRDGKLVLKNLEEGLVYETSDNFEEPMDPKMVDACLRLMKDELGFHLPDTISAPVEVFVDKAIDEDLGKTSESAEATPEDAGVVETINPEPVVSPDEDKPLTALEKARATKAANAAAKKAAAK